MLISLSSIVKEKFITQACYLTLILVYYVNPRSYYEYRGERTLSVKSLEKHKVEVNGVSEIVRLRRLGGHKVELIASTCKEELRKKLLHAIHALPYTEETEETDKRNIVCRLLPTEKKSFSRLLTRIVKLFGRHIETHKQNVQAELENAKTAQVSDSRKRSRRYNKRHKKPQYRNSSLPSRGVAAASS